MKRIKLLIFLCFCILLTGCNFNLNKEKNWNNFYTKQLAKALDSNNSFAFSVTDTNFYKELTLSPEDATSLKSFISSLKSENFIAKPKDLPQKPKYKLYLKFKNEKYVIDVYTEKYITLYPWDGYYEMDYIDMTDIFLNYNLYGLCFNSFPQN